VFAFLIRTLLKMLRTGRPSPSILVYVRFKPSSSMWLGVILLLHLLRNRIHTAERREGYATSRIFSSSSAVNQLGGASGGPADVVN
jgi:hypothetical protein